MDLARRRLLGIGAGVGAGLVLASCTGDGGGSGAPAGAPGPPRSGGTLRVGALGKAAATTRDPHGTQSNESDYLILALVYDPLTVPGRPRTVAPRLAGSWEPSQDLRSHRFVIAEGARFHDGAPVTSADVVWSFAAAARHPGRLVAAAGD